MSQTRRVKRSVKKRVLVALGVNPNRVGRVRIRRKTWKERVAELKVL